MLLSATSEALARLRVSDLTAAAPCGPSLFEHTGFCKQGGPVLDTSQARRVSGSWRMMAAGRRRSARARLRRSLPEPDPENRAAISIRSARPPIITVIAALMARPAIGLRPPLSFATTARWRNSAHRVASRLLPGSRASLRFLRQAQQLPALRSALGRISQAWRSPRCRMF